MKYEIFRECWNEKTFNGYKDNPYWRILLYDCWYGLLDDGRLWSIENLLVTEHTINEIKQIIEECKINIKDIRTL